MHALPLFAYMYKQQVGPVCAFHFRTTSIWRASVRVVPGDARSSASHDIIDRRGEKPEATRRINMPGVLVATTATEESVTRCHGNADRKKANREL